MPLKPTPLPDAPMTVVPPETVWNVPPGVASKVAVVTVMPLPPVLPLTELLAKLVIVVLVLPVPTTLMPVPVAVTVSLLMLSTRLPAVVCCASIPFWPAAFTTLFCTVTVEVVVLAAATFTPLLAVAAVTTTLSTVAVSVFAPDELRLIPFAVPATERPLMKTPVRLPAVAGTLMPSPPELPMVGLLPTATSVWALTVRPLISPRSCWPVLSAMPAF